jgi:hypothetical protein
LPVGHNAIDYAKWINILPKTPPVVGSAAIFKYGEGMENYHLGYVYELREEGFMMDEEIALNGKCVKRKRLVEWNYPSLVGFYKPILTHMDENKENVEETTEADNVSEADSE